VYNLNVSDNCDAIVDVEILVTRPNGLIRVDVLPNVGGTTYSAPVFVEVGITTFLVVTTDSNGNSSTCLYPGRSAGYGATGDHLPWS
jgi:hypothetical protein